MAGLALSFFGFFTFLPGLLIPLAMVVSSSAATIQVALRDLAPLGGQTQGVSLRGWGWPASCLDEKDRFGVRCNPWSVCSDVEMVGVYGWGLGRWGLGIRLGERGFGGVTPGWGLVHAWTDWAFMKSRGFVNFRSSDVKGDVHWARLAVSNLKMCK